MIHILSRKSAITNVKAIESPPCLRIWKNKIRSSTRCFFFQARHATTRYHKLQRYHYQRVWALSIILKHTPDYQIPAIQPHLLPKQQKFTFNKLRKSNLGPFRTLQLPKSLENHKVTQPIASGDTNVAKYQLATCHIAIWLMMAIMFMMTTWSDTNWGEVLHGWKPLETMNWWTWWSVDIIRCFCEYTFYIWIAW